MKTITITEDLGHINIHRDMSEEAQEKLFNIISSELEGYVIRRFLPPRDINVELEDGRFFISLSARSTKENRIWLDEVVESVQSRFDEIREDWNKVSFFFGIL